MPKRSALLLHLAIACPILLTGGCVTVRTVDDGVARARIGETVRSGPVPVLPTGLIEDSRCPQAVQCIQAGTVRIAAAVAGAARELTLGTPVEAGGGSLTLIEAYPPAREGVKRYPDEYRFGFRWEKGPSAPR